MEKFGDVKKRDQKKNVIKLNIRIGSIFENFKTDIGILYYLLFFNFVENKSVKNNFINAQEFSKLLKRRGVLHDVAPLHVAIRNFYL